MTKTHDAENERLKRSYLAYMRNAKQHSEASLDAVAKALHRFELHTRFKPFRAFHLEQAVAFKRHLAEQRNERTGTPLALSTQHATLAALRAFFVWLVDQPGFRRRLSYSDADYFNLSRGETRIAHTQRESRAPSLDQILHVLRAMPNGTGIERRNKALIAFTLATGARDGAMSGLRLKHVDVARQRVFFDAREVQTKFRKTFPTWFFPVGPDPGQVIKEWVSYLVEAELWGPDDPLFPNTKTEVGPDGLFAPGGLGREGWKTATPIRGIFRDAFALAGLPYYPPHSFRKTLAALGERVCLTPEAFKAWSQNLGHEGVLTTFTSYGAVSAARQGEIIRGLAEAPSNDADAVAQILAWAGKLAASKRLPGTE